MSQFIESLESRSLLSASSLFVNLSDTNLEIGLVSRPSTSQSLGVTVNTSHSTAVNKLQAVLGKITNSQGSQDVQQLMSDLGSTATGVHKPSAASLKAFDADLIAAGKNGGKLAVATVKKMTTDLQAVFSSAGISKSSATPIVSDLKTIFADGGVSKTNMTSFVSSTESAIAAM